MKVEKILQKKKSDEGFVVLAKTIKGTGKNAFPEYVTWYMDKKGNFYMGHYFISLASAKKDYKKRK